MHEHIGCNHEEAKPVGEHALPVAGVTIDGDTITVRYANGGVLVTLVDRPRIKQTWQELQRRVGVLTPGGMQAFANRMDAVFDDVTYWADEPTRDLAMQVAAVLQGYKPGMNFKGCRKLLNAAVARRFAEHLEAIGVE
jgi:hypothetical protein